MLSGAGRIFLETTTNNVICNALTYTGNDYDVLCVDVVRTLLAKEDRLLGFHTFVYCTVATKQYWPNSHFRECVAIMNLIHQSSVETTCVRYKFYSLA